MTDQRPANRIALAPWPIVIVMLGQALLLPIFRSMTSRMQISVELLLLGVSFLLSSLVLRFVDLPRSAADSNKEDHYPTSETQRLIAGPFMLLAVLILGLGSALFFLQNNPAGANAAFIVFTVLGTAVGIAMVVRVRHFSMARSQKES